MYYTFEELDRDPSAAMAVIGGLNKAQLKRYTDAIESNGELTVGEAIQIALTNDNEDN